MTTFLLIRHGCTDAVNKTIVGRQPGVHLNAEGKAQVQKLAIRLALLPIQHLCSSPLERAVESAKPLARRLRREVEICDGLTEIDFGEWVGHTLQELEAFPLWSEFNTFRSGVRPPGGEMMVEVQARMAAEMTRLQERFPQGIVALFSHADPIRAALIHYLGASLDMYARLAMDVASVTILEVNPWGPMLIRLNDTGELPVLK